MDHPIPLVHERLDAYHVARQLVVSAAELRRRFPRGEAPLGDQLTRAADSVLLNLCEGAGRRAGLEKARFFDIARGSATECAAVTEIVALRALAPGVPTRAVRELSGRLVALLSGLARSARERADRP